MSGYFPPAVPTPFLRRTGIAGKAGEEQPRKASHDKTEPRKHRPPCTPAGLLRFLTRLLRYGHRGNWHRAGEAKSRKNFGRKKTARHAQGTAGEVLLNAHQLGTLVITHPDLLWAVIAYAEIEAFKEI